MTMRRLLLVSPHFPPDSSAGAHRARILVPHLPRYGWEPVVLTVDPAAVEGTLDHDLLRSLPRSLRVVRATATSVRTARAAGLGDLGIRALRGLYGEGHRLLVSESFDAVMITTYPIYPAWLGPRFKAAADIPFVLDLQDPWVGAWGRTVGPGGQPDLRSRLSRRVAVTLERRIVPAADALVAVSMRTLEEVQARVPGARHRPMLELPIGWAPADFARPPTSRRGDDDCVMAYVGTLLPAGHEIVAAFLEGVGCLAESEPARRVRVEFIGTSNQTRFDGPPLMSNLIPTHIADRVTESPRRLPYFTAIDTLRAADVVLVLGTCEPHYTASKIYPALASGRPVVALLHEASHAAAVLRGAAGTILVTFSASTSRDELVRQVVVALRAARALVSAAPFDRTTILAPFTGDALAARLAQLLETVTMRNAAEVHA